MASSTPNGLPRVAVAGPVLQRPYSVFSSRPVRAVLTLLCLGVLGELLPGLWGVRIFGRELPEQGAAPSGVPRVMAPVDEVGEATLETDTSPRDDLAQPEHVRVPQPARGPIAEQPVLEPLPKVDAAKPPRPIEGSFESLEPFLAALSRTARRLPGAVTRVLYYGDSIVASDLGTGTLRRKLQTTFGDAGHGFVLIANAWPAYFHNDIYRLASRGWKVSRVVGPYAADGLYGLGAVSFTAPPGLRSRVGSSRDGSFGTRVSHFELAYLKQPHGGKLTISVDGEERETIDTESQVAEAGFYTLEVPDGEHTFEMATAQGMTRTFGFVLERATPGVVLDAVGIVGARIRFLDKQDDAHWTEQLKWRRPNLVVFQFGANESADGYAYPMEDYRRTMRAVLDKVHAAVPEAACFIVGTLDRARKEESRLVTVPVIVDLVKEQERVAKEAGCAFFNTFEAMGGRGSMAKWVRRGYGAGDFTHPTSVGAEVLGNWLYTALIERYEDYRKRTAK